MPEPRQASITVEQLSATDLVALIAVGLLAGFINTVAASGGTVAVPAMIELGLEADLANGTNRLSAMAGSLTATWRFHQAGVIPWPISARLSIPVGSGAVLGAWAASRLDARGAELAVAVSLLIVLVLLLARPSRWLAADQDETGVKESPLLAFTLGAIGFWSGFISLGSGSMLLMALVLVGGQNLRQANVIKVVLRLTSSGLALLIFVLRGQMLWSWALPLALASSVGALIGSRVALGEQASRWIYNTLLLVIGTEVIRLGLRFDPDPLWRLALRIWHGAA
ncbi:MAG: sulfite exporter TauE/SafE family protein [Cyanobacteriota bacterium]